MRVTNTKKTRRVQPLSRQVQAPSSSKKRPPVPKEPLPPIKKLLPPPNMWLPLLKKQLPMIAAGVVLVVLMVVVGVMVAAKPMGYLMYNSGSISYEKGKVTAVLDEQLEPAAGMPGWQLGNQTIRVQMKTGVLKGQEIELDNNLSTTHNIRVNLGQSVIIKADMPEGIMPFYTVYNYDRTPGLIAVGAVFAVLIVLVGKLKGLRSLLGLCISLYFIFALLVPAIYRGYSPVLMAFVTVIIIAVFSLLLLNGFSRKTLTAVAATGIGVALSAASFFLISTLMHLAGYNIGEAEELILISQYTGLQIGQVLFAGVLISSLGAVMDMNISIAASLYEMKEVQPNLSPREMFRSGIAIGRDMIGTMCQTLVLAFVGSSLATLLVLISYGTRFDQFMSSDYAAIEVVQGVAGSMAVILAVPITAGLCALVGSRVPRTQPVPARARTQAAPARVRAQAANADRRESRSASAGEVS
jgi:uncharacterized membrane protein